MTKLRLSIIALFALNILNAGETISIKKEVSDSRKNDTFKFSLESGVKQNYWNPGLSKDDGQYLLKYDTEGINVYYGKFKGKLENTDIFVIEGYYPIDDSAKQKELIKQRKKDNKENSFIEGVRISLHLSKLVDYLLETDTFGNFDFEYETKNFVGIGTITQNSLYWFGRNTGDPKKDYTKIERGTELSFKTKFETYKLFYTWDKAIGDTYISLGAFDATWSKPTFTQVYVKKEVPVFFNAQYHTQGISVNVGQDEENYNIKAFLDYGLNNDMKLTSELSASDLLEKDESLNMMVYGITGEYKLLDVYKNKIVDIDFLVGGDAQFSKIGRDYLGTGIDAEFNYGYHVGIEATF